jgi:hypothetical protein
MLTITATIMIMSAAQTAITIIMAEERRSRLSW